MGLNNRKRRLTMGTDRQDRDETCMLICSGQFFYFQNKY